MLPRWPLIISVCISNNLHILNFSHFQTARKSLVLSLSRQEVCDRVKISDCQFSLEIFPLRSSQIVVFTDQSECVREHVYQSVEHNKKRTITSGFQFVTWFSCPTTETISFCIKSAEQNYHITELICSFLQCSQ